MAVNIGKIQGKHREFNLNLNVASLSMHNVQINASSKIQTLKSLCTYYNSVFELIKPGVIIADYIHPH